jgi:hypothetical protein
VFVASHRQKFVDINILHFYCTETTLFINLVFLLMFTNDEFDLQTQNIYTWGGGNAVHARLLVRIAQVSCKQ